MESKRDQETYERPAVTERRELVGLLGWCASDKTFRGAGGPNE
jgi:hypothetical protein